MSAPDYVVPTASARTVAPVTTFRGASETEAAIERLLEAARRAK